MRETTCCTRKDALGGCSFGNPVPSLPSRPLGKVFPVTLLTLSSPLTPFPAPARVLPLELMYAISYGSPNKL